MIRAICFTAFTFLACGLFADEPKILEEIRGKVVNVTDGDTVVLRTEKTVLKIRLEGIDAPEQSQDFGTKSREALKDLVHSKDVVLQKTGVDHYGRTLGVVMVNGESANAKMIENGFAWHFKKYSTDEKLAALETDARTAKRGLWADKSPIEPWAYREQKKSTPAPAEVEKPKATTAPKEKPPAPLVIASDPPVMKSSGTKTSKSSSRYKESEAEKAYEKANGVEIVHRKDGTTYTRKARSKK